MKFILLNGPPRCGKDSLGMYLHNTTPYCTFEKFSFPNKRAFAGMMGLTCDEFGVVEPYESMKEMVIPALGVSYRQWQIDFSEKYMKPLYGRDIFGRLLLQRAGALDLQGKKVVVVSDCGFQVEVDTLQRLSADCLVVNIWRPGTSFDGDSREWVTGAKQARLQNDGNVDDLYQRGYALALEFLRE